MEKQLQAGESEPEQTEKENIMNETNSVPYLDQVLKANEALLGLPALPLVLLLAIALGYVLKFIPVYPNNWIPIGVILGAILANVGIAFNDGSGNYARAAIYGIIVGVASIAIHRKWLRDWLDPKMFGAFLLFGLLSFGLVGCARSGGFDRQVFRIESAALGAADGAVKGYALYYKAATNNPAAFNRTIESLTLEREQVKALSVQVGASGELVETLRLSYRTNDAVLPALQASVATLTANMAGIMTFVTNVIHIQPKN